MPRGVLSSVEGNMRKIVSQETPYSQVNDYTSPNVTEAVNY